MFKLNLFKDVNVSKFEIVDSLICNPILLGIMLCCLYIHINHPFGGRSSSWFLPEKKTKGSGGIWASRVPTRWTNLSIVFLLHERNGPGLGVARKANPRKGPAFTTASKSACFQRKMHTTRTRVCVFVGPNAGRQSLLCPVIRTR